MNRSILNYIESIKSEYPKIFTNTSVVEFGALDVNGSPRHIFDTEKYVGVDGQSGKGVDIQSLCHNYKVNEKVDVVVCTEMLEHDPYWDLSITKMVNILKDGGSLIISVAGPARPPHGQVDYTPLNSYYRNISAQELLKFITTCRFKKIYLDNDEDSFLSLFCYCKF